MNLPTKEEVEQYIIDNDIIIPDSNPLPEYRTSETKSRGQKGIKKKVRVSNENESHIFSTITDASVFLGRSIGATSEASLNGTKCAGYSVEKVG